MSTSPDELFNELDEPYDGSGEDRNSSSDPDGVQPSGGASEGGAEDQQSQRQDSQARDEDPEAREGRGKPEPTVPVGVLVAERRAFRAEVEEANRRAEEALARLKALEANAPKPEDPKAPDYLEDPKGYVDAQTEAARKAAKEAADTAQRTAQELQAREQVAAFQNALSTDEQAFAKEAPDYGQALDHIRTVREAQLKLMFPDATKEQINLQIGREEISMAAKLLQDGKSPSRVAYEYAKTLGYKPQQSTVQGTPRIDPVQGARRLPPSQSLGSSGSDTGGAEMDDDDDPLNVLDQARTERFGR